MSRNGCYFLALFAVIMALNCRLINTIVPPEDDSRYIILPAENITCIERELNQTNMDPSCTVIQEDVALIYEISDASDVVDGIESLLRRDGGSDILDIFCRPSCMQTFFEAWKTCSSFDELRNVADLLAGLCSTNNGRPCYMDYEPLLRATFDSIDCFRDLQPEFGDCNINCRTMLVLDIKTYGCCLNVFHNYNDAIEPRDRTNEEVDYIFDECRVRRPADCPTTPTVLGPTTASPSAPQCASTSSIPQVNDNDQESENTQANQQGVRNGANQSTAATAAILLLNSLIAVLIQTL